MADPTGIDLAFGDNLRFQVACHVKHAEGLQTGRFRHHAPERGAAKLALDGFAVETFRGHVEHHPGNLAAFAGELPDGEAQVGDGARYRGVADQDDICLERVGDAGVELRGEVVRGIGMQPFDDQNVGVLAGLHARGDDIFKQIGGLVGGNPFGNSIQRNRIGRIGFENLAAESAGAVIDFLGHRFGKTDFDAKALQGADNTEGDRGQGDILLNRNDQKGLCFTLAHEIS